MFTKHLAYLERLQANNTREWFYAHKDEYDILRKELLEITAGLIDFLDQYIFLDRLDARKCIFRINRDVRFSKNKDPYKTNFGIEIAPGGRRSGLPSFYLHIEPGNHSFVGGGLYMPSTEITKAIRKGINKHGKQLQSIIKNAEDHDFSFFQDRALKTIPRGYPREHPHREMLRQRDRIMSKPLGDAQLSNDKALQTIQDSFSHLAPFVKRLMKYAQEV